MWKLNKQYFAQAYVPKIGKRIWIGICPYPKGSNRQALNPCSEPWETILWYNTETYDSNNNGRLDGWVWTYFVKDGKYKYIDKDGKEQESPVKAGQLVTQKAECTKFEEIIVNKETHKGCVEWKKIDDPEISSPPEDPYGLEFAGDPIAIADEAHVDMVTTTSCEVTTLITLSSFSATVANQKIATTDEVEVILQWTTGAEIDNEGFNILRGEAEKGPYIKINETLIPAKAIYPGGTSYEFVDDTVENGKTYFYKLEDIDTNGTSTLHGPINVTVVEGHGASLEKDNKSSAWGGGCGFIKPTGNRRPPSGSEIAGTFLSFILLFIWLQIHRLGRYRRRKLSTPHLKP